jgi:TetR/AcrR family transcriptional repressor of nem operon
MDTRDRLLQAARELYWERGYHATSPRAVLASSGAGQGSLYHFFPTKADLGEVAIGATVRDALDLARADLAADDSPAMDRIRRYLRRERIALLGCPVGRLASDPDIRQDERLREPVRRYFTELATLLEEVLDEARAGGELVDGADPTLIADALVAIVQGAYVLAQGSADAKRYGSAVAGALSLLDAVTVHR